MLTPARIFFLLIFILFLALLSPSHAAPADSLKVKKDSTLVRYFLNDFERFGTLELHMEDTTLTGVQIYDPLFKANRFKANLGNTGQFYRELIFYPTAGNSGFDYGIHSFDRYLFQNDSVRYYKVYKTFSQIQYIQGAKKEVNFQVNFSRNVYRSLNIGFDFRVLSSPGFYVYQKTNQVNFVLTAQYFTKDKRYGVIANFRANRLKNYENGGIKYDSLFEQSLEMNRQLYTTNLNQAQNRVRESGFFMKHFFNLSRHPKNPKDSAFYSKRRAELGRISYSFEYNRQTQNYTDGNPKSGFYQHIYLDSLSSWDSITVKKVINEVSWTNPSFRPDKSLRLLQIEGSFKQQFVQISLHGGIQTINQYIPSGSLSFNPFPTLHLYAYADYVLGDYNKDDLSIRANLSQTLGSKKKNGGTITIKTLYAFQKPGWFYEHYYSNNFRWDTAWRKQGLISGCFDYTYKKINTGICASRINNYVYLDSTANPKQLTEQFAYFYAYLKGEMTLGRFIFNGNFAYQTVQGASVLRLPAFMGNLAIYYSGRVFRGAATVQPGISIYYNTLYFGDEIGRAHV